MAPNEGETTKNLPLPESDPSWTIVNYSKRKWVVKGESANPQSVEQDSPSEVPPKASPLQHQKQCKFFLRNSCKNGTACPFSHEGSSRGNNPAPWNLEPVRDEGYEDEGEVGWGVNVLRDKRHTLSCGFYHQGYCQKGNSCNFRHDDIQFPDEVGEYGSTSLSYARD
eukprot:2074543-Heterocapsa_arctica.AAC.1